MDVLTIFALIIGYSIFKDSQTKAQTAQNLAQQAAANAAKNPPMTAEQQLQKLQAERDKVAYEQGAKIGTQAIQSAEKIGTQLLNSLLSKQK